MKDFNLKVLFQSESILNLINESLLTRKTKGVMSIHRFI